MISTNKVQMSNERIARIVHHFSLDVTRTLFRKKIQFVPASAEKNSYVLCARIWFLRKCIDRRRVISFRIIIIIKNMCGRNGLVATHPTNRFVHFSSMRFLHSISYSFYFGIFSVMRDVIYMQNSSVRLRCTKCVTALQQ